MYIGPFPKGSSSTTSSPIDENLMQIQVHISTKSNARLSYEPNEGEVKTFEMFNICFLEFYVF